VSMSVSDRVVEWVVDHFRVSAVTSSASFVCKMTNMFRLITYPHCHRLTRPLGVCVETYIAVVTNRSVPPSWQMIVELWSFYNYLHKLWTAMWNWQFTIHSHWQLQTTSNDFQQAASFGPRQSGTVCDSPQLLPMVVDLIIFGHRKLV